MKNLMYLRYMLAVADLGLSFQVFIVLHCFFRKVNKHTLQECRNKKKEYRQLAREKTIFHRVTKVANKLSS